MFGLRGVTKLVLGEDSSALDESRQMQMQMGMGMGGGPAGFNAEAAYKVRAATHARTNAASGHLTENIRAGTQTAVHATALFIHYARPSFCIKGELEQLEHAKYKWAVEDVERRLLGRKWPVAALDDVDDYKPMSGGGARPKAGSGGGGASSLAAGGGGEKGAPDGKGESGSPTKGTRSAASASPGGGPRQKARK